MTILFDIGHPAHVHYFKSLISLEKEKGNKVIVVSRNKEVTFELLDYYKIPYIPRGKGGKNLFTKFLYLFWADLLILYYSLKNNVDIFISFASPYAAQIAWLTGKPHIALTDTENAPLGILSFLPFSSAVITPDCFSKDFGKKHIRFKGFMEISYIRELLEHPETPILKNTSYIVIRFVSWEANHDVGQKGFSINDKIRLVKELTKLRKVYISSESELPPELADYQIQCHPAEIHNILYHADLYIGEGATMASEAALMGTPAIYVNSLKAGYLDSQADSGCLYLIDNIDEVMVKSVDILNRAESFREKAISNLKTNVDLVQMLHWFITDYPDSFHILKEDPDYQKRFAPENSSSII